LEYLKEEPSYLALEKKYYIFSACTLNYIWPHEW